MMVFLKDYSLTAQTGVYSQFHFILLAFKNLIICKDFLLTVNHLPVKHSICGPDLLCHS